MKIFITGGTGFVGTNLTRKLLERGDEVTIVSSSGKIQLNDTAVFQSIKADTTEEGSWQDVIGSQDVIVNLAGRSIFSYWSDSYKKKIYSSRVVTTRNIVRALPENSNAVLLSTSAAGYYGDTGDEEVDESSAAGSGFLADVCKEWENQAYKATSKGTRVVVMRFGVVLGKGGGAIDTMKTPFKMGMGGPLGSGNQWFPWIHIDDLVSAVIFLMDGSDLQGAFNFTAPEQVRQREFAAEFGGGLKRPAILPAPSFLVKILAGEFGESLLQGQRAVPRALLESGFTFRYQRLREALQEILHG